MIVVRFSNSFIEFREKRLSLQLWCTRESVP